MKILQIVPGVDENAAGPSVSVPMLCRGLQKYAELELIMLNKVPSMLSDIKCKAFPVQLFPARALGRSNKMFEYIKEQAKACDIICTNSLWMMPNIYQEKARRGSSVKSVVMPRGTLSPVALKFSTWKKKLIWYFGGQKNALKKCDLFVATCEKEYHEIRALGFKQPVAIIPVGMEIPTSLSKMKDTTLKTMLYLSRIHKIKGVDNLIYSWKALQDKFPDWNLVIAGPTDNEYASEMIHLSSDIGCKRISFPGQLIGEAKANAFQNAHCFVLPTHSENFGIAVAEASAYGLPVITTKGAPWRGIAEHDAGWWIEDKQEELLQTMEEAMSLPFELLFNKGINGQKWIRRDFSWDEIAKKTIRAYEYILDPINHPVPEFVYLL